MRPLREESRRMEWRPSPGSAERHTAYRKERRPRLRLRTYGKDVPLTVKLNQGASGRKLWATKMEVRAPGPRNR
jgi:hypothetical protein